VGRPIVHQAGKDHALHSMDHCFHSSDTQVPISPTIYVRSDPPLNLVGRAWGGRGIYWGSSPAGDLGGATAYGGWQGSMAMTNCSCSSMRSLTYGGGLVMPEEVELGRGWVYRPILYKYGGGRPAFGEGERSAALTVQW
jgi:hypothetical protein